MNVKPFTWVRIMWCGAVGWVWVTEVLPDGIMAQIADDGPSRFFRTDRLLPA